MRYVLSRHVPAIQRVLWIESGPREVAERFGPVLRKVCGTEAEVDFITCLPEPEAASPIAPSTVFRAQNHPTREARAKLLEDLRGRNYQAVVIVCADSPLLFRWKWWLAFRLPAKVLVANENADCYWLDIGHWRNAKGMLAARYGLSGAGSLRTLGEVLLFPFVLAWLLLFALHAHMRRAFRLMFGLHRIV